MDMDSVSSLIDTIYDAAVDDKGIPKVAERLARLAGARTATVTLHACDMREFAMVRDFFLATLGIDFTGHFLTQDVWQQAGHSLSTLPAQSHALDGVPIADIYTRFYLTHADPSVLGLNALITTQHGVLSVAISRPLDALPFTAVDAARLQALVPHLQRMHQMRLQMQRLETRSDVARAALDRFAYPTLILQPDRHILLANAAATDTLVRRQGLFEQKGRLYAQQSEDNKRLSDALHTALNGNGQDAEICQIGRGDGLEQRVIMSPMADRKSVFLVIDDPATPRPLNAKISQLYGLSAAETALTEALMRGETPEDFALARNVRITTVRSQLSSLLRKTETERQAQLIASMSRLPSLKIQSFGEE
ncbi:luxR family transcriptional regulator [Asticcacaulis biprosthecium C19]|uniref:LuxR family transcriptional regulator n=1 Tax=Asticcacaulis biprosthecium C19 TaxID=715226 RepID=F4QUB9_9CAUL|nr:helix-turn-helix transcriptional regulator [Asticcacaulis biprosthecium]EGF89419.1 luxR family transcriptional regulator [Asticcacaulis biprosthecium C19]